MALTRTLLAMLGPAHRLLQQRGGGRRLQALTLAYPDLAVPPAALDMVFGAAIVAGLPVRPDAAEVCRWHGLPADMPIYDSVALFDRLGIDLLVTDIAALRGMERILDLNEPLPADLQRRFDLVIDPGTTEHCFNVGLAFRNVCEAVRRGGLLLHLASLSMINHGFWNVSPTVYPDYFEANGFRLLHLSAQAHSPQGDGAAVAIDPFRRFPAPPNAILHVMAERLDDRPPAWPVQRKYRQMLGKAE
jgi:hypothetical protein